ncbi:ROK family protein [Sphaerisporangium sp. NPDC051017]|uniref:ROK family protein n=1 Tax=Sphaerisporangium sp. NPDC051017 TaxID=3154636 RepID=UPI003438F7DA
MALDVGGTAMKGGLVGAEGEILLTDRRPTPRDEGPLRVIEAIRAFVADLARAGQGTPSGVGVAVPGLVTEDRAVYSANIGWKDVPAADYSPLDVPVRLGHDVRTGGLAESVLGAGRGERDFLFLPIGTGIAGAVVMSGTPYGGSSGCGGEIGHVPVFPGGERCACGQVGCLETYASAASVARRYAERLSRAASTRPPGLPRRTGDLYAGPPARSDLPHAGTHEDFHHSPAPGLRSPGPVEGHAPLPEPSQDVTSLGSSPYVGEIASARVPATAEDVVHLAMRGDPAASAVWDDALEALSYALATYTLLLDPSMIVLGGGLAEAGPALFDPLAERLQSRLTFRAAPPLRRAALGMNAGMLGAALLGWQAAGVPDPGTTWALDVLRSPSVP